LGFFVASITFCGASGNAASASVVQLSEGVTYADIQDTAKKACDQQRRRKAYET
jgi:hypothetical protein